MYMFFFYCFLFLFFFISSSLIFLKFCCRLGRGDGADTYVPFTARWWNVIGVSQ